MKYVYLIFSLVVIYQEMNSQNLVGDPSFEEVKYDDITSYTNNYWSHINTNWMPAGYSYLYLYKNGKSTFKFEIDFSEFSPKSGNAALMIRLISSNMDVNYLQCRLLDSLIKDQKYKIEFYTCFVEHEVSMAISNIGLHICDSVIMKVNRWWDFKYKQFSANSYINTMFVGKYKAHIKNKTENYIDEPNKWVKISGEYIAKGGEQYLTLGFFYIDSKTLNEEIEYIIKSSKYIPKYTYSPVSKYIVDSTTKGRNDRHIAIYAFDDFLVVPIDEKGNEIIKHPHLLSKENENYFELKNILFEHNKYQIKSFSELDSLCQYLNKHTKDSIHIIGYTNNIGTEEYNKDLSEKRARSVYEYLINKGIDAERVSYQGLGIHPSIGKDYDSDKYRMVEIKIINFRE